MIVRTAIVLVSSILVALAVAGCGTVNMRGAGTGSGLSHGDASLSVPVGK